MGTLSTIGVISGGDLSITASSKYRDAVVDSIKSGISIGSTSVQGGLISMGSFETDPIGNIESQYPAWYGYYVRGILTNTALTLDTVPSVGVLKPIGIFDPTAPIAAIIAKLQDLFLSIENAIGIPVNDILVSQIDIVIQNSGKIIDAISNKDTASFFDELSSTISAAFNAAGKDTTDLLNNLNARKEDIQSAAEEIIESATSEVSGLLPSLPVPNLDVSFMDTSVSTVPLFASIEANGHDGIVTKFLKTMTVFFSIPGKVIEAIISTSELISKEIQEIKDAVQQLLSNFIEGVKSLLNAIVSFVWNQISNALSILSSAILEISSLVNAVLFFAKCFAVSLVGFLLGPGLVAFAVAKALNII